MAFILGMSLEEVLKREEWSNVSPFISYYYRRIEAEELEESEGT